MAGKNGAKTKGQSCGCVHPWRNPEQQGGQKLFARALQGFRQDGKARPASAKAARPSPEPDPYGAPYGDPYSDACVIDVDGDLEAQVMAAAESAEGPALGPAQEAVILAPKPKKALLQDLRDMLHFLWQTTRAFDKSVLSEEESFVNFDDCFDWESTREARHVVHGSPGGKWGEVECSWLRVELKGMEEAEKSDEDGEPTVSYHGTRWPKLPWILKQRSLQGGPREAGGKNGVWTSPVFKTAETYAWPEPLGSAAAPHYDPWADLASSKSSTRYQAVLELEILKWRRHSRCVYVTVDAKKASLKAVHLRCWKEGAEDHAELRQSYFPSSFMPNGTRLWYVAGSEPHWLDKEKAEPSESAGVIGGSRAPKKQKRSGKSAAATQKSAEKGTEASNSAEKVPVPDLDVGKIMWDQLKETISEVELREKLYKYLQRTYQSAIQKASTETGPKPATFLLLWAEEAAKRLVQASWGTELLQHQSCVDIVKAIKLMLQRGLVPAKLDGYPPRKWTRDLEDRLHETFLAKFREGGCVAISVVE